MGRVWSQCHFFYEQQVKREVKRIHTSGYRCNERLKAKTDGSNKRLAYTDSQLIFFFFFLLTDLTEDLELWWAAV